MKKQASSYKQAKDEQKAKVQKAIREGKVNPGNAPHEPKRKK